MEYYVVSIWMTFSFKFIRRKSDPSLRTCHQSSALSDTDEHCTKAYSAIDFKGIIRQEQIDSTSYVLKPAANESS